MIELRKALHPLLQATHSRVYFQRAPGRQGCPLPTSFREVVTHDYN